MANIRITALPADTSPNAADVVPIDNATTRKTTLTNLVNAGRPFATQPEAEAGTSPTKGMSPLTTAQAIAAIGGATFASLAQGVPAGGTTNQVLGKVSNTDNDVSWRNADAGGTFPYDVMVFMPGVPANSALMARPIIPRAVTFPSGLSGSYASATAAATAATVLTIKQNGSSIGSVNFALGATTGTFTFASPVTTAAGDVITITNQASADATLTNISVTLVGTR